MEALSPSASHLLWPELSRPQAFWVNQSPLVNLQQISSAVFRGLNYAAGECVTGQGSSTSVTGESILLCNIVVCKLHSKGCR